MWESATGNLVRQFTGHSNNVGSAFFSSDGRYLVTETTTPTRDLDVVKAFTPFPAVLDQLLFTPAQLDMDLQKAMAMHIGNPATNPIRFIVRLWETATGEETRRLSNRTDTLLDISTDGPDCINGRE